MCLLVFCSFYKRTFESLLFSCVFRSSNQWFVLRSTMDTATGGSSTSVCQVCLPACLSASVIGRKYANKCGIPQKRATGSDCRIPDSDEKHSDELP